MGNGSERLGTGMGTRTGTGTGLGIEIVIVMRESWNELGLSITLVRGWLVKSR